MKCNSYYNNGIAKKNLFTKNEENCSTKGSQIVGTWFQNRQIRNSLDDCSEAENVPNSIGSLSLIKQDSIKVKYPTPKNSSPVKATVFSLPTDTVTNGFYPQHINHMVNIPRPPPMIFDFNKMAYRHQPSKSENIGKDDNQTINSLLSDNNKSPAKRLNDGLSNISFNDKYILSFNYLCSPSLNQPETVYRNSINQNVKPPSEPNNIDCLSIKPATKFQYSKPDRSPKYNREYFPYPDPCSKASRSFINRLNEISTLTQNTVRLERSKNRKITIKRSNNDLAQIACK